jgi:WD40 repeat protein
MIRVWEMDSTRQSNGFTFHIMQYFSYTAIHSKIKGKQLAELKYHKLGITCISFIKNSNYLISVGNQHDKSIVVWNWKTKLKLAENRLTNQVNAMDVNQSGMIVTAGSQHVKFWYLDSKDEPTVLHVRFFLQV